MFPVSSETKVLSVTDLTRIVKQLIEDALPSVWVQGQISNCRPAASGHVYLTLKDKEAQLPAVIWRSTARKIRFQLHDGLEVIAQGRLEVYAAQGKYQLIVDSLQPKGLGPLELAFRQLCEKLSALGYFAPERKRPLPRFPKRIAIVTSPTGAAIRDMLEILGRRWPGAAVWVCPVRVQGDGSAQEIASAIGFLNRFPDVDVMIVGRGGGSLEDLWAFNEECVAKAIFMSRIPVVSAVGHEIDVTVADLVADRRALTPSEAAEIVAPNGQELIEGIRGLEEKIRSLVGQKMELAQRRLQNLAERRAFRFPLERIRDREQRLDDWSERLHRTMQQSMKRIWDRFIANVGRLESLSPLNVLKRGYSLTQKEDGAVIFGPEQVSPGDLIRTRIHGGSIASRVEEVKRETEARPVQLPGREI